MGKGKFGDDAESSGEDSGDSVSAHDGGDVLGRKQRRQSQHRSEQHRRSTSWFFLNYYY